jgi:hypothetical protein
VLPIEGPRTVGQQGPNAGDAPHVEGFGRGEPHGQRFELCPGAADGIATEGCAQALDRQRLGGGTDPSQASREEASLCAVVEMLRMNGECDARLGGSAGGECAIEGGGAESGHDADPRVHVPQPESVTLLEENDHCFSSFPAISSDIRVTIKTIMGVTSRLVKHFYRSLPAILD